MPTDKDLSNIALTLVAGVLWVSGVVMGLAIYGMWNMRSQIDQMNENNAVNNIYVQQLDARLKANGYSTPDLNEIRKQIKENK